MRHRSLKSLLVLILLVLSGIIVPRATAQGIVTNGSFETPTVPSGNGIEIRATANLGGWILDSGSIDLIAARGYYQVAVGSQCIFLSGGGAGSIYQDLNTTPGQTYRLKFAMSGDPGKPNWPLIKRMSVDWDNSVVDTPTFDITSTTPANMGWVYHEYLVTATSNVTRLRFTSLDSDPTGPAVDDVTVTPAAPTLHVTDLRLGFPEFKGSGANTYLSVKAYLKGDGSGEYTGRWQRNGFNYSSVPPSNGQNPTIDLTSGDWQEGPELQIPWARVTGNYTLRFALDTPDMKQTADLNCYVTGFRPDVNGWSFRNFGGYFNLWDGLCLGMSLTAQRYYPRTLPSFSRTVYTDIRNTHVVGNNWALSVDAPRLNRYASVDLALVSEADRIQRKVQSGIPTVMLLDARSNGRILSRHAVVTTSAFYGFNLLNTQTVNPSEIEAPYAWVFGLYDSNLPGIFNHVYVAGTTSGNKMGWFPYDYSPSFNRILEYTGPNQW